MTRVFVLLFLLAFHAEGQNIFVNLKPLKNRIAYHEGKFNYAEATRLYELALHQKRFQNDVDLHFSAFQNYFRLGDYPKSEACLQRLKGKGVDSLCEEHLFSVLATKQKFPPDSSTYAFYQKNKRLFLFRDSASYQIENWEGNTSASEYGAVPYKQGLLWTKSISMDHIYKRTNLLSQQGFSTLAYSAFENGSNPVEIRQDGILHCGPAIVLSDNRIVTNLVGYHQKRKLELYYSSINAAGLQDNRVLEIQDFAFPVSQPSFSKDQSNMYFVSSTPQGYGGTDIFVSHWSNGRWGKPTLLGPSINSPGNERYPCLLSNGTLAFTSDGKVGLGGMDIYFATLGNDTLVYNPGFPFNSNSDDFSYAEDTLRNCAWVSSNRNSKGKEDDILKVFTHRMNLEVRLYDEYHQRTLTGVKLSLVDVESNQEVLLQYDTIKQVYRANIKPDYAYQVKGYKEGYFPDSVFFITRDSLRYVSQVKRTLTFRKRNLYYASIKIFREEEVNPDSVKVRLINLTSGEREEAILHGNSFNRRLELECEYLVVSGEGESIRYIYIEKKPVRKGTTMTYYNMYLSQPKPVKMHIESEVFRKNQFTLSVFDLIQNTEVELKRSGNEYIFAVLDSRFFEVKMDNTRFTPGKVPKEILGNSLQLRESERGVQQGN